MDKHSLLLEIYKIRVFTDKEIIKINEILGTNDKLVELHTCRSGGISLT